MFGFIVIKIGIVVQVSAISIDHVKLDISVVISIWCCDTELPCTLIGYEASMTWISPMCAQDKWTTSLTTIVPFSRILSTYLIIDIKYYS